MTSKNKYCHIKCVTTDGDLDYVGLIDHIQVVAANNYTTIADFHSTNHWCTHTSVTVYTNRFLITASNNGYSSASCLKSFLNGRSLPTELFLKSKSKSHCD
jgi:hypothetical protein